MICCVASVALTVFLGGGSQLDRAVENVRADAKRTDAQSLALAAARYVNGHVRPARWAALPAARRPADVEGYLRTGAGLCGSQIATFLAIADELGLRARPVEFYYSYGGVRNSHIVTEVYWGAKWHLIDVTWMTVYRGMPSVTELFRRSVAARERSRITRPVDPWINGYLRSGLDPFSYFKAPDVDITINDRGLVHVPRSKGRFDFANVPNYVGVLHTYGNRTSNISLRFTGLTKATLTLDVYQSGCLGGKLLAKSRTNARFNVPNGAARTMTIPVSGPTLTLSIASSGRVCWVMLSGVR